MKFNSICHRPFIRDFLQFVALLAPMHFLNPVGSLYLHRDTNPTKRTVLALREWVKLCAAIQKIVWACLFFSPQCKLLQERRGEKKKKDAEKAGHGIPYIVCPHFSILNKRY